MTDAEEDLPAELREALPEGGGGAGGERREVMSPTVMSLPDSFDFSLFDEPSLQEERPARIPARAAGRGGGPPNYRSPSLP